MPRISNYVRDANVTIKDKLLGSSYEGEGLSGPIFETRNFRIEDLIGFFSNNVLIDNVNYNLKEITDFQVNLANSLGDVNQDGSLTNISIDFANDLVAIVSTVPDIFTELALSNLSAVPKAFADFLFTIADANEAFANQVLDLATSVAYATADQFDSLSAFTTQLSTNVQGLEADFTNLSATVDANTGAITANATSLTALGVRVTVAETDVVALNTNFTNLQVVVNENTGDISTNATQISTLGTVVDTATTDIATLKTDVTLLESSIDTLSGDVTANASDISLLTTNVNTEIDGLKVDVTALDTEITTLTTTVNNNTGDIATQATQVSLLANRVDTAEADILNTQTNVTTLSTTVDGNTGNISTNASNISILQTNVDTQQAQITGIITDIQQIETSVDNVTGDVEANAIAITGVGTRVTTAEAEIDNVQGNITTLTTNLNTQTGRIDTNVQNISTLSTAVTDPTTGLVALQGQITTVDNARISGDQVLTSRADLIEAKANGNTANITTNATAIATVDGKLTASYGVQVNAGGKIAGLKLLADGSTTSSFIAQADEFGVEMPNGTRVLTVNSGGLVLNGSGTFSGSVTITSGPTLSAITAAQSTADTAIGDASDAASAASTAQSTANTAQSTANTAQSTANTAQSTANTANTNATTALNRTVDATGKIVFNPTPSGSGLFMNATNLGYYDGGSWKTYMQNNGNFFLSGSGGNGLSWNGSTLTVNGSGVFSGELQAGLVNINSNVITFGASDSSYSQTGKIRFNNYLGTQIGELRTSSGVAGGSPRSTITIETLGGGVGLDPVLSLRSGYGWDIGDSNMGTIYGYRVDGINKLNLFADTVLLNSGPFLSSTGYQRIWGNFTIQWVRRTYTTNQQVPGTLWPVAFTSVFGAVVSKGWPFGTHQTQNEAATVSYTTDRYYVDMNNSAGGTFFIIALGMIADPT